MLEVVRSHSEAEDGDECVRRGRRDTTRTREREECHFARKD